MSRITNLPLPYKPYIHRGSIHWDWPLQCTKSQK